MKIFSLFKLNTPRQQLALLLFLWLLGVVTSGLFSNLLHIFNGELSTNSTIAALSTNQQRLSQVVFQVFAFFLPSLFLHLLIEDDWQTRIHTARYKWIYAYYAIAVTVFMAPIIDIVSDWNMAIHVGGEVETWLRSIEDRAAQLSEAMLTEGNNFGWVAVQAIFIMAVLPALCEEFFFRGTLQPLLIRWFKSPLWGIVASAFIFSLVHFQFYGFIPRLLLGMAFGYIAYQCGHWLFSALMHFLNNGFIVVIALVCKANGYPFSLQDVHFQYTTLMLVFCLLALPLVVYRLRVLRKYERHIQK